MEKNNKIIAFLLVLCIIPNLSKQFFNGKNNSLKVEKSSINISTVWDLTGVSIQINNLEPSKSWNKIASDNEWCFGNGTWNKPYIIENISINSLGLLNSIEIKNSNDFFIIRNSLLYNSSYNSIALLNTTNGRIIYNNLSGLGSRGITFDYSNNNTMIGNIVTNNGYGIYLSNSRTNTFIQNKIKFNNYHGIYSYLSDNNTFLLNNISYNGFGGLFINGGDYNNISYNTIKFNQENGIDLYSYFNPANFNFVMQNNVSYNQYSGMQITGHNNYILKNSVNFNLRIGILLLGDSQNIVENNTCNSNSESGLRVQSSSNNNLTMNYLANNKKWAIELIDTSENNTITQNVMVGSDIGFPFGSVSSMSSQSIDTTNLVNGKKVYYYTHEIGLNPNNFTNSGQTILVNCSGSNIVNAGGIGLYYSNNNSVYENDFSSRYYGIFIYESNYNNITNNSGYGNSRGIMVQDSLNNSLSNNSILESTEFGIYIIDSLYTKVTGNKLRGCGFGLDAEISIYSELASQEFDLTNTVNGGIFYYYKNRSNLGTDNFSNAGQIILLNCSYADIKGINASVTLYYSDYVTISYVNISLYFNYGIYLYERNYANITSVIVSNSSIGIYLRSSYFNKIVSSTIYNSTGTGAWEFFHSRTIGTGVLISSSMDNVIINNSIFLNIGYGLHIRNGDRTGVYDNNIIENKEGGIFIEYSNDIAISKNRIDENIGVGVTFRGSDLNNLRSNSIKNNHKSGVFLIASDDNQFFMNIFQSNTYGIYLTYSATNNLVYNNSFFENVIQDAYEEFLNTQWDDGLIGNSWTNYIGKDINDDGIGDSAYYFDRSVDNYPLWWDAPKFEILNPHIGDFFGIYSPEFSLNITEGTASSVKYSFNNETTSYSSSINGFVDQDRWDLFGSGEINILFSVNDSRGVAAETKRVSIIKDIESPNITILSPDAFQVFNSTPPHFILEIVDTYLFMLTYTVNNQTPASHNIITILDLYSKIYTCHINLDTQFWDGLPNGEIIIKFYANDTVGNREFKEITIIKNVTDTTEAPSDTSSASISAFPIFPVLGFMFIASIFYYYSKKVTTTKNNSISSFFL